MVAGSRPSDGAEASWRFTFASGFTFGVGLMLLFLGVASAGAGPGGVTLQSVLNTDTAITSIGAALFAIGVGSALFLLAFPANREWFQNP